MEIQGIFDHGNGWWVDEAFRIVSDKSGSRKSKIRMIVLHWTAAPLKTIEENLARIKSWATNKEQKSTHFVILRDGRIFQMIQTNRRAWHAGDSSWTCEDGTSSKKSVNDFAIGIDFDLVGPVTPTAAGLRDCYGGEFRGNAQKGPDGKLYEPPTNEQLWAARVLIDALSRSFLIPNRDIVGHKDVSPGRKIDPGPFVSLHSLGLE